MWNFIWNIIGRKAVEPIKPKVMLITKEKFTEITGIVIDNFEGGYYHPDMLKNFKASDQAKLKASGETLFGLDRKAGAQLAKYPEWAIFWAGVDLAKEGNPADFKYNKRGGAAEAKLKALAASIMYQWFSSLAAKYLKEGAVAAILNDERLLIHFSYACWNGEGWFKRFVEALNKAIIPPAATHQEIYSKTITARTGSNNKVILQQGANMLALFKKLHI